jgi:plasmid stability protein
VVSGEADRSTPSTAAIAGTIYPMNKITVYLPDGVKQALSRLAAASGRSEADLISEALTALARTAERPRPRGGLWQSGDILLADRADEALAGFGDLQAR